MTNDIWGMLGKKKGQSVTIPTKKTNNTSAPTAQTTATAQPKTIKPPKVRAHKVQKHKVQRHAQVTEPQINDFNVSTSGDANVIYINILYQNHPIYRFTLPKYDFDNWQYRMDANQRLQYVTVRVNANATVFENSMQIIQTVITAIYQILNNIFSEAQRMRAQQQARRSMI